MIRPQPKNIYVLLKLILKEIRNNIPDQLGALCEWHVAA